VAYDDDNGNGKRGRDWEDFASLFERFLGRELTVNQVIELTRSISTVAQGRSADELTIREISEVLRESKLSGVPVETVAALVDVVAPLAGKGDVLEQVTLSHLHGVVGKRKL
jgi:hypothetical protein